MVLAVLGVLTVADGCWLPHRMTSECGRAADTEPLLSLQLLGPEHSIRGGRSTIRDAIYITLYDGWIRLNFNNPYYEWCEQVSEGAFDSWIAGAELLGMETSGPHRPRPDQEVLGISTGIGRADRGPLVEVGQLTAATIDATRSLLCLSTEAFGPRVERAILEITPGLAARAGYPGACARLQHFGLEGE